MKISGHWRFQTPSCHTVPLIFKRKSDRLQENANVSYRRHLDKWLPAWDSSRELNNLMRCAYRNTAWNGLRFLLEAQLHKQVCTYYTFLSSHCRDVSFSDPFLVVHMLSVGKRFISQNGSRLRYFLCQKLHATCTGVRTEIRVTRDSSWSPVNKYLDLCYPVYTSRGVWLLAILIDSKQVNNLFCLNMLHRKI